VPLYRPMVTAFGLVCTVTLENLLCPRNIGVSGVYEVNIVFSYPYHSAHPAELTGVTGVLVYSAVLRPTPVIGRSGNVMVE
jgi:hypothetical protein